MVELHISASLGRIIYGVRGGLRGLIRYADTVSYRARRAYCSRRSDGRAHGSFGHAGGY